MSGKEFVLSTPFSLHNGAVVLESDEDHITFGLMDMTDEALKSRLEKSVETFFRSGGVNGFCEFSEISREQFEHVVSLQYGLRPDESTKTTSKSTDKENGYHAAVLLLDSLLDDARNRGATDIHIEENRVRFRINGTLETVCSLAEERSRELVRRVKMLAKLDVLEARNGQDGQFVVERQVAVGKKLSDSGRLFVRVSVIPVVSGKNDGFTDSLVLRLLDPKRIPLDFSGLGFSQNQCALLSEFAALENGLVLIWGSTGSGKSTTAAALLEKINGNGRRKIITIEEPPEYVLDGITQIAVDSQFGMDFASALRAVFRQDPDVLFIGEIRDEETARVAVQAAVTGHLVFATLHTGGFYETIIRLGQLGVEPKAFASVLRGIIVQHLDVCEGKLSLSAEILRLNDEISWSICSAEKSDDIQKIVQEAVI